MLLSNPGDCIRKAKAKSLLNEGDAVTTATTSEAKADIFLVVDRQRRVGVRVPRAEGHGLSSDLLECDVLRFQDPSQGNFSNLGDRTVL